MIKHEPGGRPDDGKSDDDLYALAQQISSLCTGLRATDVLTVLSILLRYALEQHVSPDMRAPAFEHLRSWVLGEAT